MEGMQITVSSKNGISRVRIINHLNSATEWRSTTTSEDCRPATVAASSSRSNVGREHRADDGEDDGGAPPEKDSCDPSGSSR
ncbi:hypothetical protein PIB30_007693 [Stylosanthes scabra]|uniref:Uncharacterized protein n=1 Tax=Stylosanthes scabra TaxID=79078 RepID=A0ABU6X4P0_9FABA|nr:hypothetical protein [Stylosanthes scabra]